MSKEDYLKKKLHKLNSFIVPEPEPFPLSYGETLSKFQVSSLHAPVLLREVLHFFETSSPKPFPGPFRFWDGTFGRGGHFLALKSSGLIRECIAFDQDPQALEFAHWEFSAEIEAGGLVLSHENFSQFSASRWRKFDIMLMDLGVSSPQLDDPSRGFSFYKEGPLDMRMNTEQTLTAEYFVNTLEEKDLLQLFQNYGEIRNPYRVVKAILHDRKKQAFTSTLQLAQMIERVDGWKKKGFHPATQYFQALRMLVNKELESLKEALPRVLEGLEVGGRLAVISFHSLEDRIVKWCFKESLFGSQIHKKVIEAQEDELEVNPRSRSAKLRVFERRVQDELGEKKDLQRRFLRQ